MNKNVLPVNPNGQLGTMKNNGLLSIVRNSTIKTSSCYSDADKLPSNKQHFTVVPNFTISRAQTDLCNPKRNFNLQAGIKQKKKSNGVKYYLSEHQMFWTSLLQSNSAQKHSCHQNHLPHRQKSKWLHTSRPCRRKLPIWGL